MSGWPKFLRGFRSPRRLNHNSRKKRKRGKWKRWKRRMRRRSRTQNALAMFGKGKGKVSERLS